MQFRILHVAQDAAGVIEFSVVQIGQGGDRLGIAIGTAGIQSSTDGEPKRLLEPIHLAHQQHHAHPWIEQLIPGPGDFVGAGVGRQSVLVDQFGDGKLRRSVGFDQSGVGNERKSFSRFGVLNFVKQDGRDQHRIDAMLR